MLFMTFQDVNNWKAAPSFMMTKTLAAEMSIKFQYTSPSLDHFYWPINEQRVRERQWRQRVKKKKPKQFASRKLRAV